MAYIIGYTSIAYQIGDIYIPSKSTQRSEKDITEVNNEELAVLKENSIFKTLLAQGSIKVLDTKPSWAVTSDEKIQAKDSMLADATSKLNLAITENEALKKELAELKSGGK